MELGGKKWFWNLNKNADSLVRSQKLEGKFVVSHHAPRKELYPEGKIFDEEKIFHLYAAFDNPSQFLNYYLSVNPEYRSFFEVIMGDLPQKPYFDVDISKDPEEELDLDQTANDVMTSLIACIVDCFARKELPLDLNKDLMIFTSHSDNGAGGSYASEGPGGKRSFHVVINGYYLPDHLSNGYFAMREILAGFPREYLDRNWLDSGMYKSIQQFRLFGCGKAGTRRRKILLKDWSFGSHQGSTRIPIDETLDENTRIMLEFKMVFLRSCVGYLTPDCKPIPLPEERRIIERRSWKDAGPKMEVEDSTVALIMQCINRDVFTFRDFSPDGFNLLRLKPSFCELCQRVHKNENAKIMIEDGTAYFCCFRNRGGRHYLGKVPVKEEKKDDPPLLLKPVQETQAPMVETVQMVQMVQTVPVKEDKRPSPTPPVIGKRIVSLMRGL